MRMKRRRFLEGAAGAAAFGVLARVGPGAAQGAAAAIDTNVYLGRWPFRRLPLDEQGALEKKLKGLGVGQAWAGSFDALLHRDLDAVNERLAAACVGSALLRPAGAVNPAQAGWRETLRRCHEVHGMRILRLHPNYHGYALGDAAVAQLLGEARERNLLVQIAMRMEDPRTQHPRVVVEDVDPAPLVNVLTQFPGARVQLLNAMRAAPSDLLLQRLGKMGVHVEIAMLEGVEGVRNFLDRCPSTGLVFGSHAPFFYPEAAHLKVAESELADEEREGLLSGRAKALAGS